MPPARQGILSVFREQPSALETWRPCRCCHVCVRACGHARPGAALRRAKVLVGGDEDEEEKEGVPSSAYMTCFFRGLERAHSLLRGQSWSAMAKAKHDHQADDRIHLTPMMVRTAPFECRCCRPCRRENQLSTWEAQSVERECGSVLSSDQSVVLSSSLLLPRLLPSLSCWADDRVALPCPPLSRSLLMKAHAEPPPLRGALPRVRNYYIKVKRSVLLLKPTGAI
ncbi:hypothetical protein IWX47DRAFT_558179 [Phyllosticta citricarpa]